MKRCIGMILVLLMLLGMGGCVKKDYESEYMSEPVVLRYMGWGAETEKMATQEVIKNFEAENPGIEVEYIHVPYDYNTKLSIMLAEGNEPDVAMLEGYMALEWAEEGKLKNIFELAEADTEFSLDGVLPNTIYWWDEGKACGVNSALETYTLFYNRELTEQAGVQVPSKLEDAWTWEEFIEAAQKLTIDKNGHNATEPEFDPNNIKQYGVQFPLPSAANMLSMAAAYSEEAFLNAEGNTVQIKDSKIEEAIQKIADLIHVYHVVPSLMELKELPFGATALQSKTAAMIWEGQWALMELSSNQVDFGIGVLPKMYDKSMTFSLGEPIVTFSTTEHPEEAWKLQKAFMDTENIMGLIEGGLWMPIFSDWYTDKALLEKWAMGNEAHPEEYIDAVVEPVFDNCVPALNYSVKNFAEISAILSEPLEEIWNGEKNASEALTEKEKEINKAVKGKYCRP